MLLLNSPEVCAALTLLAKNKVNSVKVKLVKLYTRIKITMNDNELLYREMNEEDPYYMGPRCDDARFKKLCVDCRFCRDAVDGSMRCSVSGRRITDTSKACANFSY